MDQQIIKLNVRGQTVQTYKSTLERAEYFKSLFARWTKSLDEPIFLDLDPEYFRHVLNKLSDEDYTLPDDEHIIKLYSMYTCQENSCMCSLKYYNSLGTQSGSTPIIISRERGLPTSFIIKMTPRALSTSKGIFLEIKCSWVRIIECRYDEVYAYFKKLGEDMCYGTYIFGLKSQYIDALKKAIIEHDLQITLFAASDKHDDVIGICIVEHS